MKLISINVCEGFIVDTLDNGTDITIGIYSHFDKKVILLSYRARLDMELHPHIERYERHLLHEITFKSYFKY